MAKLYKVYNREIENILNLPIREDSDEYLISKVDNCKIHISINDIDYIEHCQGKGAIIITSHRVIWISNHNSSNNVSGFSVNVDDIEVPGLQTSSSPHIVSLMMFNEDDEKLSSDDLVIDQFDILVVAPLSKLLFSSVNSAIDCSEARKVPYYESEISQFSFDMLDTDGNVLDTINQDDFKDEMLLETMIGDLNIIGPINFEDNEDELTQQGWSSVD